MTFLTGVIAACFFVGEINMDETILILITI